MSYYHHCGPGFHPPHGHPGPVYHPGVTGIFGGVVNLTVSALQGGARLLRTVVEGTVWHAGHDCCGPCGHPPVHGGCHCGCCAPVAHHCCHVECLPPVYPGGHPCC
jgi:hypothetical protein